jgi:hypothetical protein
MKISTANRWNYINVNLNYIYIFCSLTRSKQKNVLWGKLNFLNVRLGGKIEHPLDLKGLMECTYFPSAFPTTVAPLKRQIADIRLFVSSRLTLCNNTKVSQQIFIGVIIKIPRFNLNWTGTTIIQIVLKHLHAPIMWEMKWYLESRSREISRIK